MHTLHARSLAKGFMICLMIISTALGCSLSTSTSTDPLPSSTPAPTLAAISTAAPTPQPTATSTPVPTAADTNTSSGNAVVTCTQRTDWPVYRVVAGDTLANLARRTGSSVTVLANANCLDNPDALLVGQALYVPRQPDPAPANPPANNTQPGWETFTSSRMGFAFDYPGAWYLTVENIGLADTVTVSTFDPAQGDPPGAAWPSQTQFQITWAPATPPSLNDWVVADKEQLQVGKPGGLELYEQTIITLPGNAPAIKLVLVSGSGHVMNRIYSDFNGEHILIMYMGKQTDIPAILNSLRPA